MTGPGTQRMLRLGPFPLIPDPRSLFPDNLVFLYWRRTHGTSG
jgi:hypothetical protein